MYIIAVLFLYNILRAIYDFKFYAKFLKTFWILRLTDPALLNGKYFS